MYDLHTAWLNDRRTRRFTLLVCDEHREVTDVGVPVFNTGSFLVDVEGVPFALSVPTNAMLEVGR